MGNTINENKITLNDLYDIFVTQVILFGMNDEISKYKELENLLNAKQYKKDNKP